MAHDFPDRVDKNTKIQKAALKEYLICQHSINSPRSHLSVVIDDWVMGLDSATVDALLRAMVTFWVVYLNSIKKRRLDTAGLSL